MDSVKEYIISKLGVERDTEIRMYGETGQELIDDEDLPESSVLFYTITS